MSSGRCPERTRHVVPEMRERRFGKIVNIASDSALIGDVK